jgi:hypothetical protein
MVHGIKYVINMYNIYLKHSWDGVTLCLVKHSEQLIHASKQCSAVIACNRKNYLDLWDVYYLCILPVIVLYIQ